MLKEALYTANKVTKDFQVKANDRETGQDTNTARSKTGEEEKKCEKNKI